MAKKSGNLIRPSHNKIYIPDTGDLISAHFNEGVGHEQSGHRPALVMSLMFYNRTGKAIVWPITTKMKNNPFEIILPQGIRTTGVILADQIINIDWREREAYFIEKVEEEVVKEVFSRMKKILPGGL